MMKSIDLMVISETWWDETHKWNVNIAECSLYRKKKLKRRGRGDGMCQKYLQIYQATRKSVVVKFCLLSIRTGEQTNK